MVEMRGRRLGLGGAILGMASVLVGISPAWHGAPAAAASTPAVVRLGGVAALSSGNAWAVGAWRRTASSGYKTLIEHWTAGRWRLQASPSPGNDSNSLTGVAALSSTEAWAVGSYHTNGQSLKTLIEHWNGTAWKVQPSPSPVTGNNTLSAVGRHLAVECLGRRQHAQHKRRAKDADRALERQVLDRAAQPKPWFLQPADRSGRGLRLECLGGRLQRQL
jgi:hypothetical protein